MTSVPAAVLKGGHRERVRETLPRQELLVRELLRRTDSLLERLEALNLRGEARAPKDLEDIARGLLQPAGIAVRDCTVAALSARSPAAPSPGAAAARSLWPRAAAPAPG